MANLLKRADYAAAAEKQHTARVPFYVETAGGV